MTAQKVNIGMIFRQMLGAHDAREYLAGENVPEPVIERVLAGQATRLSGPDASPPRAGPPHAEPVPAGPAAPLPDLQNIFYGHSGRRRNMVQAALVQAAITVGAQLGRERAERLLRREQVADEVIARVLADPGPGQHMRRKPTCPAPPCALPDAGPPGGAASRDTPAA